MTTDNPVRSNDTGDRLDVLVVGGGLGGMCAVHRFRGLGLNVLGVEAAETFGGVWYHNSYPGARVDVPSVSYSFSFSEELQQAWAWSEQYASQPELLRYIDFAARKLDLHRSFRFGVRVQAARFSREDHRWHVGLNDGSTVSCRFLVLATGGLSAPVAPEIEGLSTFEGAWYQTSRWPKAGVDLCGKRVGIVGTGSSGIQAAIAISEVAGELTVFQRTPVFTLPARNAPLDPAAVAAIKSRYAAFRQAQRRSFLGYEFPADSKRMADVPEDEREALLERYWQAGGNALIGAFRDTLTDETTNAFVSEFVRRKIRAIVTDPAVADLLCPYDHPIGSRRICIDTGYYEIYNRPNVTLVDLKAAPIERITSRGIQTDGTEHVLDVIVFAIGFDALTGPVNAIDISNADGLRLKDAWTDGPDSYLGFSVAGFPNLFIPNGPGGPSVLVNVIAGLEHDIDWIANAIAYCDAHGMTEIEATQGAQAAWSAHVAEIAAGSLYMNANSWYLGSNIKGKPRRFLAYAGGLGRFAQKCETVAAHGYEGFTLS